MTLLASYGATNIDEVLWRGLQGLATSPGIVVGRLGHGSVVLSMPGFRYTSGGIRGEQLGRSTGDLAFS